MAEEANIITPLCLLGLLVLGLLSVVPVDLQRGWKTLALYYPVLGVGLFALYEAAIQAELPPETVPIRIDWAFVHPLVAFILFTGVSRWYLVSQVSGLPEVERKPGTGAQLVAVIVSLGLCLGWFCVRLF
jgi:hypothetical protein